VTSTVSHGRRTLPRPFTCARVCQVLMSQRFIVPMRTEVRMVAISAIRQAATEFLGREACRGDGGVQEPEGAWRKRRVSAHAGAGVRGICGQPQRTQRRRGPCLPQPELDPRRRPSSGDRHDARDRPSHDARMRRARNPSGVDAPRWWLRQRLTGCDRARPNAWDPSHRWWLPADVRFDLRPCAQVHALGSQHVGICPQTGELTPPRRPAGNPLTSDLLT